MADGPEFCILCMKLFLLHFPRSHKMALLSSISTLRFIPCPLYECPALKLNQGDKLGLSTLIFSKRKMIFGLNWFYFLISYKWWDCAPARDWGRGVSRLVFFTFDILPHFQTLWISDGINRRTGEWMCQADERTNWQKTNWRGHFLKTLHPQTQRKMERETRRFALWP